MAKFNKPSGTSGKPPVKTEVRNSPIPRASAPAAAPAGRQITREMIAIRAYEISQSPSSGSELDNWLRAERELRGGR